MVEKICEKGEFWAWIENSECVMEGESGEQVEEGHKAHRKVYKLSHYIHVYIYTAGNAGVINR